MTRSPRRVSLGAAIETLRLKAPFRITGHVFETVPVLVVTLEDGAARGRGEAAGVYYFDDTPGGMAEAVVEVAAELEAGVSREALRLLYAPRRRAQCGGLRPVGAGGAAGRTARLGARGACAAQARGHHLHPRRGKPRGHGRGRARLRRRRRR